MRRLRVLVDADGVLGNFVGAFAAIIRRECGVEIGEHDVTGWDIFAAIRHRFDDEKRWKLAKNLCHTAAFSEGFHDLIEPYPGAVEGVRELEQHADVYIVTSPWHGPFWTYERDAWLKTHFGIGRDRIVHTSAKHLCVGQALIDDRAENCQAWTDAHPSGIGILWDRPWNADADIDGAVRMREWPAVVEMVEWLGKRAA